MGKKKTVNSIYDEYTKKPNELVRDSLKKVFIKHIGNHQKRIEAQSKQSIEDVDQLAEAIIENFINNQFHEILDNSNTNMSSTIKVYAEDCRRSGTTTYKKIGEYYKKIKKDLETSNSKIKMLLKLNKKPIYYLTKALEYTQGDNIDLKNFKKIFHSDDINKTNPKEEIKSIRSPMVAQSFLTSLFSVNEHGELNHKEVLQDIAETYGCTDILALQKIHGPFKIHFEKLPSSLKTAIEKKLKNLKESNIANDFRIGDTPENKAQKVANSQEDSNTEAPDAEAPGAEEPGAEEPDAEEPVVDTSQIGIQDQPTISENKANTQEAPDAKEPIADTLQNSILDKPTTYTLPENKSQNNYKMINPQEPAYTVNQSKSGITVIGEDDTKTKSNKIEKQIKPTAPKYKFLVLLLRFISIILKIFKRATLKNNAATKIQSKIKTYKAKSSFNHKKEAATKIQSVFRTYKAKSSFNYQKEAATKIQSVFRTNKAKLSFNDSKKAATKIQSMLRTHKEKSSFRKKKVSAIKLQSFVKKSLTKKHEGINKCIDSIIKIVEEINKPKIVRSIKPLSSSQRNNRKQFGRYYKSKKTVNGKTIEDLINTIKKIDPDRGSKIEKILKENSKINKDLPRELQDTKHKVTNIISETKGCSR